MPSTRKQRAKERRSRQLDIMSDTENLDVMLGSYPRNELGNDSDRNVEIDLGSDRTREDPLQNSEDFRSLLNSNSNENSLSTAETMRLVNSEITKKIDELRRELNSQLVDVINSAITEKVLPDIRNLVSNQNPVFREEVDQRSSGLNRTTEAKFVKNAWKGNSKLNLATSSRQDYFRRNSENSQSSDDGHEEDILTNSHDNNDRSPKLTHLKHWVTVLFQYSLLILNSYTDLVCFWRVFAESFDCSFVSPESFIVIEEHVMVKSFCVYVANEIHQLPIFRVFSSRKWNLVNKALLYSGRSGRNQ